MWGKSWCDHMASLRCITLWPYSRPVLAWVDVTQPYYGGHRALPHGIPEDPGCRFLWSPHRPWQFVCSLWLDRWRYSYRRLQHNKMILYMWWKFWQLVMHLSQLLQMPARTVLVRWMICLLSDMTCMGLYKKSVGPIGCAAVDVNIIVGTQVDR